MAHSAKAPRPSAPPRCLLVEDSEFDQKRIARILANSVRVDLHFAATIAEARRMISGNDYALILLDNHLPDGLGVDLAAELRAGRKDSETALIMISDWPSPFMYDKAVDARVNCVLSKDEFRPRHVREALRFARVVAISRQPLALRRQDGPGSAD